MNPKQERSRSEIKFLKELCNILKNPVTIMSNIFFHLQRWWIRTQEEDRGGKTDETDEHMDNLFDFILKGSDSEFRVLVSFRRRSEAALVHL